MKKEINELDNTKVSTLPVITKNIMSQADDLAEEHEQFNSHYIIGGRLALYDLLAKILALYQQIEASPNKKSLLGSMKHKMVHTYRMRVQSNSSDSGILVRYITRTDRKTAHVYARAIETAIANGISVAEFCDYIQRSGGIEQMRSIGVDPIAHAKKEKMDKDILGMAWSYCQAREELPFALFDPSKNLDYCIDRRVTYEYFACVNRKGRRYVLAKIPADKAFEDRAIKLLGDYFSHNFDVAQEKITKLVEKSVEAKKERITKENAGLTMTIRAGEKEEKSEV